MHVTLEVNDKNFEAFMDYIKTLDYVSIKGNEYEVPEWQQREVAERLAEYKKGNIKTKSWDEVRKNLLDDE